MEPSCALEALSKEQLIELIGIYSKDWLAHDGLWFQSVEQKLGMDEAMFHDVEAWRRFTVIEAQRLKKFLKLDDEPGLDGLCRALELRFYANINRYEFARPDANTLIFRHIDCRVQHARSAKGMPLHPCRAVGEVEYAGFAKTIDPRITCRCISCFPDVAGYDLTGCAWEFKLSHAE